MTNAPIPDLRPQLPATLGAGIEVQPPAHVRDTITLELDGEFDADDLRFVVYNDTPRDAWLTHLHLRTAEETEAHLTLAFMWGIAALWLFLLLIMLLGEWARWLA